MSNDKLIIMIYFLSLAIYGITEIVLQRKSPDWKKMKMDSRFLMLLIPFYMCVYLSPLEYIILKPALMKVQVIIGFSLFYIGLLVRILGFVALGNNFSIFVQPKSDSKLVVNGIYKYVRHPLYLAVILISVSGTLIFSCIFMWVLVLFTIIGILLRIRDEESFLVKKHMEYIEYKKRTKRLVPFVY